MSRYLYGAAIQGIQKYIFQTQKLKDIIGASALVKQLCDKDFKPFVEKEDNLIIHAAGNVKCIFDNESACRDAVLHYPKTVMEKAPGVTISQAVVKFDGEYNSNLVQELERKLHAQRNRPCKSLTLGGLAIERSRTTGLPAVDIKEGKYLDEGTLKKQEALKTEKVNKELMKTLVGEKVSYKDIAFDTEELTDHNDWIAIIHADGNGLGEVVAKIGKDGKKGELKTFSQSLDQATIASAQRAYHHIEVLNESEKQILPIRPIVIGGDDLTVICRGDLAIPFVRAYLNAFEDESKEKTGYKLTACAGIAFVKSSYPFSFGYELAEALCSEAKKDAKSKEMRTEDGLAPSCLMFHKVQSSFVEDYATIKQKELMPQEGHSLCFGPYYLKPELVEPKKRWTIDTLTDKAKLLSKEDNNTIKTSTRKWLSLMNEGAGVAEQHCKRVLSLASTSKQSLYSSLTEGKTRAEEGKDSKLKLYPAYDVLALHTIMNQKTKD